MIRMTIAALTALFVFHLVFPAHGAYIATCSFTLRGYVCAEGEEYVQPDARIVNVPRDNDRLEEKIKHWQSVCQPRVVVDALGVERMVYAHPGCEFGRTE